MNGLGQFVTKAYDKTPVKQRKEKMATGKPKPKARTTSNISIRQASVLARAGKPVPRDKALGKVTNAGKAVLRATGSQIKPIKDPYTGKMTKPVEAGLGVVGAMAKAVARTTARNAGKSVKGLTQKEMRDLRANRVPYRRRDELNMAEKGRGEGGKIRSGIGSKAVSQRRNKVDQLNKEQLKRGITSKEDVRGRLSSSVASKKPNYGASISSKMKTSPIKRKGK